MSLDPEMEAKISSATLKEAIKEAGDVVTCLYRLSITIQNAACQNRSEGMEQINIGHFERFNIDDVDNKYQLKMGIGCKCQYLIECLGKVNMKRQQILKYNEEYHERIISLQDTVLENIAGLAAEGAQLNKGVFFSQDSSAVQTIISTVYEGNFEWHIVSQLGYWA